jgi:hypothetical protein
MIKSRRIRSGGHVARMGGREMHIGYWWEIQKERGHQEDRDIGGWIILKRERERERGWCGMDWIDLPHDREQWRALVNTVINLWVP